MNKGAFSEALLANYGRKLSRYQRNSMILCFPKP